MIHLWSITRPHFEDDSGASMVEYAFLLILIAMIAFVAVGYAGTEVSTSYSEIADGFPA